MPTQPGVVGTNNPFLLLKASSRHSSQANPNTTNMDLKIQCHCGTKYKFEFQPVDGRVPFQVICPTCGTDATEFANSRVQDMMGGAPATPSIAATTGAAPMSPAISAASSAPATSLPSKLRVRSEAPAPAIHDDQSDGGAAPVARPARAPMFVPPPVTPLLEQNEGLSPRFFLGVLGGLLGVLVGCLVWYAFVHFTGKNFRIVAVVVGFAAGLGTKIFSKDLGKSELGSITGAFVLVGLIFTAYFIGRDRVHGYVGGFETEIFKEEVAYAKRAVTAVPKGTEQEIRMFLAREEVLDDEKPDPAGVDRDEVRLFRDVRLGHYKELAAGKIPEKDYFKVMMRWEHEVSVADAKHTLALMPTGSDREIRAYLAEQHARFGEEGEKPNPNAISKEEIATFRTEALPELKALASGERPFQENTGDYKTAKESLDEFEKSDEGGWAKFIYFFSGWGLGGLGIMVLTVGLAYKICTHAD
ncbi:MAG: hypothetical protein H0X66_01730 [Verrucomicrobia bacterium]|nr:hypothetical protein [Verrucomicrobiota bacterium]